jgi:hypothetical protein
MGETEQPLDRQLLDNKNQVPANKPEVAAGEAKHGRPILLLLGSAVVFVVIALALGLGLGLGLKHHHNESPAATTSSSPTPTPSSSPINSTASETLQSWRRDTAEYDLDMSWDLNAPPTTRIFNLTLSEIQAAPDGRLLLEIAMCPH